MNNEIRTLNFNGCMCGEFTFLSHYLDKLEKVIVARVEKR